VEQFKNKDIGDCVLLERKKDIYLIGILDSKPGFAQYAVLRRYTYGDKDYWVDGDYFHTLTQALSEFNDRISEEFKLEV